MKEVLLRLTAHETLSREEAKKILMRITKGEFNNSLVASFLTVYMMRNITVDELAGFRDALLELCLPVDLSDFNTIDLCGTGGDGKHSINISTLASFVVAGAGEKVAKHGNYGVSSACGSSNIMEYFGYKFSNNRDELLKQLEKSGICFLHAPLFHPAMKTIAPIRRELGLKTFFNMLGPLVNPSFPHNQLTGVYNLETARLFNYIYQGTDKNYTIVYSLDGYDEISLTSDFKLISNQEEQLLSPEQAGFSHLTPDEIRGGETVKESAEIFLRILKGEGTAAWNSVVTVNAGMALKCMYMEKTPEDCIAMAQDSLLNGKALQAFNKVRE